jgi:hypothetical protein
VHFADKLQIFLEVYRGWVASEWQAITAAIATEHAAGGPQSLRIARAVLWHHREWRIARAHHDGRAGAPGPRQGARAQIAQTSELLEKRGVRQTPAGIYTNLLCSKFSAVPLPTATPPSSASRSAIFAPASLPTATPLLEGERPRPRAARAGSRGSRR